MKQPIALEKQDDWSVRSRDLMALLSRVGIGDRAAFAQLYERTSPHLFAVILRIHRDRAQAEDVLQEVYVNVWRAARTFDPAQSQPLTWLTSIARNRAIDSLRRQQSRPQVQPLGISDGEADAAEESALDRVADDSPGPLELLSRASDARALGECLDRLGTQQRHSVALAFYHGLSHAEVAEQLRQPLGTVKSWVRRALLTLKGCLQGAAERDVRAGGT